MALRQICGLAVVLARLPLSHPRLIANACAQGRSNLGQDRSAQPRDMRISLNSKWGGEMAGACPERIWMSPVRIWQDGEDCPETEQALAGPDHGDTPAPDPAHRSARKWRSKFAAR